MNGAFERVKENMQRVQTKGQQEIQERANFVQIQHRESLAEELGEASRVKL